jgi:hypothetical protein
VIASYLHTKIREIPDPDFQSLVEELCLCINFPMDEFVNQPLSYLLMVVVQEKRALTRLHAPMERVLAMKVDKLPRDSAVYWVCRELVDLKGTIIECLGLTRFDGHPERAGRRFMV